MKVSVCDADGLVLRWMVATVEGLKPTARSEFHPRMFGPGPKVTYNDKVTEHLTMERPVPCYATCWLDSGPIIDRERITVTTSAEGWEAYFREHLFGEDGTEHFSTGPTPQIAAMRCHVSHHLGDEVEVPDNLFPLHTLTLTC